ncbi:G1/S-specific cyclin-E2 [Coemansia sp. RSA 1813]|nr:G1/S-specific cyclin-E2 [Coemansia sp. RSA 1646]KAJ1771254.1 G1/S-specific cyclin-E2 [Coemansia sp. RSA 1843]KAJ2092823.1 G1/S-specific cyclin-E2 [Coemansia sp. RSA 986]KAJ2217677.1 G1/S-specific cyclin-E2 [Coemansia sp. RSA 487]KAJ2573085.1 G1/S-specific cyclin-E2 [Coemansia sp. RSA 1813]
MPRISNKENTVALGAVLGPSLHSIPKHTDTTLNAESANKTKASLRGGDHANQDASVVSSKPTKPHKRTLEVSNENSSADNFVDKAKRAIKRRCTEMGIRKYASLSSMSAKHTHVACDKQDRRASRLPRKPPTHDYLEARDTDPSSEATIILLPSEYGVQGEEEEGGEEQEGKADIIERYKSADLDESSLLESQITLVAPSSPFRLQSHDVADISTLPSSEAHDVFVAAVQALTPPEEDFPDTCEDLAGWLLDIEREYALGLDRGIARHPELSGRMRPILVDWLMEVAADYRMHRQTLHLTVQYLDRFLAHTPLQVQPSMLQCYGTACLSVAMKMEEKHVPSLMELTDFSKDAFTCDQLKQAELDVLEALGWHLAVPTAFEFLCLAFQRAALHFPGQFADATMPDKPKAEWHPSSSPASVPRRFDARQFIAACDHVDALLHNQSSLRFSASELAAACFYLSTTSSSLDGTMFTLCTGYSFVDIFPVILHVKRLKAKLDPDSSSLLCAKQCCETKDRYSRHLKRIRPAELWTIQPHHPHLLPEFEDLYSS